MLERVGAPLEVTELELAPPGEDEVLVRLHASGVCHSDLNAIDGTAETRCPAVLGHEGAGVVEAVGPGVELQPGTRVVLSWLPDCGECGECRRGLPHLCRRAWAGMATGGLMDGTPRLSRDGEPVFHYCFVSSFAERAVVPARCCVPIPAEVPFDIAALVGCAITTGTGAVWRTAAVRPGEAVCVIGCGGVGMSAILGAVAVGAAPSWRWIWTRRSSSWRSRSGPPTPCPGPAARRRPQRKSSRRPAVSTTPSRRPGAPRRRSQPSSTRPRGAAVLIGIPSADAVLSLPAQQIPRSERRVLGSAYGSARPERDFPALLDLYLRGRLPLDRLISARLPLEAVEQAFDALRTATALRTVLELDGAAA